MRRIENDDFVVEFEDTREVRDAVFEEVIKFYAKHESFSGESIMQCDSPLIDAPNALSKIADNILKFKVTYKED